jgi:predicted amidophosphoribosyltransferase
MPVCTRCAQANPEIALFCLACGAPLVAETQAAREMRKAGHVAGASHLE